MVPTHDDFHILVEKKKIRLTIRNSSGNIDSIETKCLVRYDFDVMRSRHDFLISTRIS